MQFLNSFFPYKESNKIIKKELDFDFEFEEIKHIYKITKSKSYDSFFTENKTANINYIDETVSKKTQIAIICNKIDMIIQKIDNLHNKVHIHINNEKTKKYSNFTIPVISKSLQSSRYIPGYKFGSGLLLSSFVIYYLSKKSE